MDVDSGQVQIVIVLHHADSDKQQLYYDGFVQLKDIFYETVGENDWTWVSVTMDEYGKRVSIIQKRLTGVNMFKNEDWPAIISFLKPRIIALDAFWSMARYQFSSL